MEETKIGTDYYLADMDAMEEIELGRGFDLTQKEELDEEDINNLKKLVLHIRRVGGEFGYMRETIYEEMIDFITEEKRKGHKFQIISDYHPDKEKFKSMEEK